MVKRIDLFDSTYGHFTTDVLQTIRNETFGQDIGQNSWTTVEDLRSQLSVAEKSACSESQRSPRTA